MFGYEQHAAVKGDARARQAFGLARLLSEVDLPNANSGAASTGVAKLSPPQPTVSILSHAFLRPLHTFLHTNPRRAKLLHTGRGGIAQIHYTGEEAAGEINKLLGAVVSTARYSHFHTDADTHSDRERRRL